MYCPFWTCAPGTTVRTCSKIVELEEELRVVGNNLKSLEVSEEKVRRKGSQTPAWTADRRQVQVRIENKRTLDGWFTIWSEILPTLDAGHDLILSASLWLFDDKEFDDLVWSTAFRFLIKVVKTYIWNWTICTWIINDQVCSEFFIVKPRTSLRQTNWRTIGTISIPQTNSLSWTPKLTEDWHEKLHRATQFSLQLLLPHLWCWDHPV